MMTSSFWKWNNTALIESINYLGVTLCLAVQGTSGNILIFSAYPHHQHASNTRQFIGPGSYYTVCNNNYKKLPQTPDFTIYR